MAAQPTLEPQDAEAAAAMLAAASADGRTVVLHGHRTKLRQLPDADNVVPISTRCLSTGLAHYAGDLVATVPVGQTLRTVNEELMRQRQWLPLDPPFANDATIGGIVAANDSGPRRQRYGNPRDLIIGIEVALPSGTVARSGGRVVKNVAGYDLARLFCGSRGTLGLITSVTFKLSPAAPASRTVVARFARAHQAADFAVALAADPSLTPSTLEVVAPDPRVLVRFETTPRVADLMAAAATRLAAASDHVATLEGDQEAQAWAEHQRIESVTDGLAINLSVLPTVSGPILDDVDRLAAEFGVDWMATGRAALGILRIRATGDLPAMHQFTAALHVAVAVRGGHMQCAGDLDLLDSEVEPLGDPGSAAAVGFAVKQRFDPAGVLPYPWARS